MKNYQNDGGPAFPVPMIESPNHGPVPVTTYGNLGGMTLRDWFAGQALPVVAMPASDGSICQNTEKLAAWAYELADAMLAERNKEEPKS